MQQCTNEGEGWTGCLCTAEKIQVEDNPISLLQLVI